jgi:hypothetical protein
VWPRSYEVSGTGYEAFGTLSALYLLAKGSENRIEPVSDAEAARALLQHILFFADDAELLRLVFDSVFDFISGVPVRRLVFATDTRVWELIT